LLGINVIRPVCIEGGPVYNHILSMTEKYGTREISVRKGAIGYRIGLGVDYDTVMITLSYQGTTFGAGRKITLREPNEFVLGLSVRLGT